MLPDAELVYTDDEVQAALLRVAAEINAALAETHPLVLSVMDGAVMFTGQLLPLLDFPLTFGCLHVSRYGNNKRGGEVRWKMEPEDVAGRTVLVLDDILDEGETLFAIKQRLMELGAIKVYSAVFAEKNNDKVKPVRADFAGLTLPDRFVFGYGMDIEGLWRNLPAIYALSNKEKIL